MKPANQDLHCFHPHESMIVDNEIVPPDRLKKRKVDRGALKGECALIRFNAECVFFSLFTKVWHFYVVILLSHNIEFYV